MAVTEIKNPTEIRFEGFSPSDMARRLIDSHGYVDSLAYVEQLHSYLRTQAETLRRELSAALGQQDEPEPPKRARSTAPRIDPPKDAIELLERVRAQLAAKPRPIRALCALTRGTKEEVQRALTDLGAQKGSGRNWKLPDQAR